eukprot:jgi/Hompol1/5973/HPOL_004782-RA
MQPAVPTDNIPLPGAIRENSKYVEALLRASASARASDTRPDDQSQQPGLQGSSAGAGALEDHSIREISETPTPASVLATTTQPADGTTTPVQSNPISPPLSRKHSPGTDPTTSSTRQSSNIASPYSDSRHSFGQRSGLASTALTAVSTHDVLPPAAESAEPAQPQMSVSIAGNLSLLKDITTDISRKLADAGEKGLDAQDCQILKNKVDIQMRCILSLYGRRTK